MPSDAAAFAEYFRANAVAGFSKYQYAKCVRETMVAGRLNRLTVHRRVSLLTIAAGWIMAATAAPEQIIEPLLGLRLSPVTVRFVAAHPDLARRCPDLVNENFDHRLWVLARASSPKGELMVVSGRFVPRRPELPDEAGDAGVLLRLRPGGCDMIGPADEPFEDGDGYAPEVTHDEMRLLANDAARRYVAAYGGAGALCAAARRQHVRAAKLPALLRGAFRRAAPCLARQG